MLSVAEAESYRNDNAIHCVLRVLWMKSCMFAYNGPLRRLDMRHILSDSPGEVPEAKCDTYDCLVKLQSESILRHSELSVSFEYSSRVPE